MKHPTAVVAALLIAGALSLAAPTSPASATASTNTVTGRVSVLPGPAEAPFPGHSTQPVVSATGRYVVFTSKARLSEADPFDIESVYVRDLLTDQVELVSVGPGGAGTGSWAYAGAISPDGRYVVFSSLADNLVANDTNGVSDVFLRDRTNKTTERVSINSSGQQSTKHSPDLWGQPGQMDVSADGRYVAFTSESPTFAANPNNYSFVLVRDRQTSTTDMVSVSSAEALPNRESGDISMTPDGRYVAFRSQASNLDTDNNGTTGDIFVRDRSLGTTKKVSLRDDESHPSNVSFDPSISDDGNKVAFISRGDLTPGDLTSIDDVFVRNIAAGTTTKISVDFGGAEADQHATHPVISGDGTTVAWTSLSGEYISGGGNGKAHIFKRVGTTAITRQSVTTGGALGSGDSAFASLSTDGKTLVFESLSTNLVTGDTGSSDIFVRRNPEVGPSGTTSAYAAAMVADFNGAPNAAAATAVHNRILQGASPEGQVLILANGTFAAKRAPLVRLYTAYFKRLPDTGGLTYWLNKLNGGMKLDQVSAKFAASSEFKTKYGNTTNSQFVTLVYTNVLDRNPDAGGLAHWVKKMEGGMSRGTVMTNFSESSEGKRHFRPRVDTALISLGLLGKIGPAKLMTAVTDYMVLDSSARGVERLVVSPEYAAA